jgi:hypothetical protein
LETEGLELRCDECDADFFAELKAVTGRIGKNRKLRSSAQARENDKRMYIPLGLLFEEFIELLRSEKVMRTLQEGVSAKFGRKVSIEDIESYIEHLESERNSVRNHFN